MEIFKSDELKKEFKRFEEQDLMKVLECGSCQKTACQSFRFQFCANFVEKRFAKIAINLMQQKMFSQKKLTKSEKITLKTL